MTATDHATTTASTASTVDLLVAAYREILGVAGLDRDSDFYEVGGDSLTAFQITGRIQDVLGVEVPVSLVFAYPTPADLASVVDSDFARA
ncbi:acyl carrier protein [Streptomyces pini]|uniref:Phosphopantetheine attachment site n=1 Tax=Streptomyces pini TaxID=1520580 RepID=A0A1I3XS71_9ACTN|nr:acyl carrier protein [Streptomyces pini]SFK22378.1 Phosphopantetheine attachment site [Streptomyces pini]